LEDSYNPARPPHCQMPNKGPSRAERQSSRH
jgi:hypothetical protein